MLNNDLPMPIQLCLDGYRSSGTNLKTCSNSGVFLFEHPDNDSLYLKVFRPSDAPREATLRAESTAVSWLSGQVPVPRLVEYCNDDGVEYMVTAAVDGLPSHSKDIDVELPALIHLLADGLRQLHALPIQDCPLDNRVEAMCRRVETWMREGAVAIDELPEWFRKANLDECVAEIRRLKPDDEDLVFTHGDYCLPNILIGNGQIAGFIDLGYAGIADRYCDFICIDFTIRHNLGDEWVQPFWDAYGVAIEPAKFGYYQQLYWIL